MVAESSGKMSQEGPLKSGSLIGGAFTIYHLLYKEDAQCYESWELADYHLFRIFSLLGKLDTWAYNAELKASRSINPINQVNAVFIGRSDGYHNKRL